VFIFVVTPFMKLRVGNKYCCEQPVFRWKYAIYYGECWEGEGGDGCEFTKIEENRLARIFWVKKFCMPM
jgi:hypothetical protein